jgi:hypothetical protein
MKERKSVPNRVPQRAPRWVLVLGGIILVLAALLAYSGFCPGLSHLIGSDRQRDLGMTYTADDLKSGEWKIGARQEELTGDLSPAESIQYRGQKSINTALTAAEATALLNSMKWRYSPVKSVQVKFNPDGTFQMSGLLLLDRLGNYEAAVGKNPDQFTALLGIMKSAGNEIPFYLSGKLSIKDNAVDSRIDSAELGRMPLPLSSAQFNLLVEDRLGRIPGLSIRSMALVEGKMALDSEVPDSVKVLVV